MDAEVIKLAIELADKITSMGFMLVAIAWLIKKIEVLESMVFGDWKRQRDNEHEKQEKELIRKEMTQTGL